MRSQRISEMAGCWKDIKDEHGKFYGPKNVIVILFVEVLAMSVAIKNVLTSHGYQSLPKFIVFQKIINDQCFTMFTDYFVLFLTQSESKSTSNKHLNKSHVSVCIILFTCFAGSHFLQHFKQLTVLFNQQFNSIGRP